VRAASREALSDVTLPTLVGLQGGAFALLTDLGDGQLHIQLDRDQIQPLSLAASAAAWSGDVLDLSHSIGAREGTLASYVQYVRGVRAVRSAFGRMVLLSAALASLGVVSPLIISKAVDLAIAGRAPNSLDLLMLGLTVVALHEAWLKWLSSKTNRFLDVQLRFAGLRGTFERALAVSLGSAQRRGYGALSQDLASSEALTVDLLSRVLMPLIKSLAIVGYALLLLSTSVPLALLALAGAVAVAVISAVQGHRAAERAIAKLEWSERERAEIAQVLTGMATIKTCSAERERGAACYDLVLRNQLTAFDEQLIQSSQVRTLMLIRQLVAAGVLLWSAHRCVVGDMTVGALLLCSQASMALLGAVEALPLTLRVTSYHLRRIEALPKVPAPQLAREGISRSGAGDEEAISIQDVWFRHDESSPWLFRGLSLSVKQGETVSLRWVSGAGKTTLLRLIAGLYSPQRGSISVAGREPRLARSALAYLPQTSALFEASLLENLRLLSGGAPLERINAAAGATGLLDLIQTLPMGLDTRLSARGGNLSGGQRQLLLVTAVLASNKPIILLDEATANLDATLRARLAASGLLDGRTVLLASHDTGPKINEAGTIAAPA
jgi:ATP-binding cassette, subfamily B, bacterial